MKKKALAFAAMACSVAMLLSACGGSNSNAASGDTAGSNIITAYNSEPQNPLIPGNTNEYISQDKQNGIAKKNNHRH